MADDTRDADNCDDGGSDIEVITLSDYWPDSTGSPLALFESTDPPLQAGTFRIDPAERVPTDGWTHHSGPEIAVVLNGALRLVTRSGVHTVSNGTVSVVPEGVEHYSENPGPEPVHLLYVVAGET